MKGGKNHPSFFENNYGFSPVPALSPAPAPAPPAVAIVPWVRLSHEAVRILQSPSLLSSSIARFDVLSRPAFNFQYSPLAQSFSVTPVWGVAVQVAAIFNVFRRKLLTYQIFL